MKVIVAASIGKCASTAGFNLLRRMLMRVGSVLSGPWRHSDTPSPRTFRSWLAGNKRVFRFDPRCDFNLVKVHQYDVELAEAASFVLLQTRTLYDVMASEKRENGPGYWQDLDEFREHVEWKIDIYKQWRPQANVVIPYWLWRRGPTFCAKGLAGALARTLDLPFEALDWRGALRFVEDLHAGRANEKGSLWSPRMNRVGGVEGTGQKELTDAEKQVIETVANEYERTAREDIDGLGTP